MKKVILPFFFIISFCCFIFFLFFVLLGEFPLFATHQKEYREKLLHLEKHYNDELIRIEKKTHTSLANKSFSNWLDSLLRGENYINLSREEAKMVPNKLFEKRIFVIKDPFLSNFLVMNRQGKLLYTYDRFDGDMAQLNQIALLDWDGFSVSNSETLNLIFPTSLFSNSRGKKIKDGYIVLLFKLKEICRALFAKNNQHFDSSRLISYRHGFVYNMTDIANVEDKVSEIVDRAYKINSKWKFITSPKEKLSFLGYRLSSGVLFAYLYPATWSDMSWLTRLLFLVFFANLTILLAVLFFKKNWRERLWSFSRSFVQKWNKPPSIPLNLYQKYWQKKTKSHEKKEEILSLLKDLDKESKNEQRSEEEVIDERAPLGIEWNHENAKLVTKMFLKSKEFFVDSQERFFTIKNILQKLSTKKVDATLSEDSFSLIAIMELQQKKWVVTEYSGMEAATANRFSFQQDHPLMVSLEQKKSAICIKAGAKGSPLLKNKLSTRDYQKIYGILFIPIILDAKSKKIEMFIVLG